LTSHLGVTGPGWPITALYRTGVTENQLKGAPKYGNDNAWNWNDPAQARSVNDYYGVAI
jgi:hypothetical protein